MKKATLISLLTCLFCLSLQAQAPQAVCYQAVAKDANGNDLFDKAIKIRASIIRGNPNGIADWIELHDVTTDQFGLFSLEIGKGIYAGGFQLDFKNVPWHKNKFYLRIEMDAAGGSNFTNLGTTQILSVPYSLFSEKAGKSINSDTAAVALSVMGGGGGGSVGASADFPQGIVGKHVFLLDQNFTVPSDKNFYVTAGASTLYIDGFGTQPVTPNMPVFPPDTKIANCYCTGFLVDTTEAVQPILVDLTNGNYTVPAGKAFYVKSGFPVNEPSKLVVNSIELEFYNPSLNSGSRIIALPENVSIDKPASYNELILTGYLMDEGN